MPKHPAYDDLFRFIDYILKQFFKCVREKPFFLVEVLFNKGTKEGLRAFKKGEASDDNSDAQEGGESSGNKTSKKKDLKLPVEIEIKPGLTWSMRLGVAVGLLAENHKSHLINKVVDDLRLVVAGRVEIIQSTAQANGTEYDADQSPNLHDWLGFSKETPDETLMAQIIQPPWEALEKFEDYQITVSGDDEYQEALQRDPQLHTLLRELQWESREEPPGHLCWQVPKNRVPGELEVEIKTINYFLANPLDHDGKSAAQLTRRKRKTKRRTRRDPSISSNRDLEATAKAKQTRQEKKQQETNKYLSAQFITESDDEDNEERDRLFFEKERQLRLEVSARALAAHQPQGPSDTSVALPQVDLPRHKIRPVRTGKRRPSSPSRNNDGSMMDLDPPAELALETEENAPHSSPSGSSMGAGDKARGGTTTPTRSTSPSSALSSGPKVLSSMGGQKRDISSISNEFDTNDHESDQEPLRSNRQVKNRRLFLESDEE